MTDLTLVHPRSLFQTDLFRNARFVQELCDGIGQIYVTKDTSWGQHGHFTTLFGVIVLREGWYPNPHMQDLYFLHELWHRKTLVHKPGRTWLQWTKDLINSELESSLMSECFVYLFLPQLRRRTFQHEIWVDRFLSVVSPDTIELAPERIRDCQRRIREGRLQAINNPRYDDYLEHQIWNYGRQNMQFCRIWGQQAGVGPTPKVSAFRLIDERMSKPNWTEGHLEWLLEHTNEMIIGLLVRERSGGLDPERSMPFPFQAEAFGEVYDRSVEQFGNAVLSQ